MKVTLPVINGMPQISVNGEIIDSLAFKSFRPTAKNVKEFYEAGVRLFHVYCSGLMSGLKVPYSLFGETWFGPHDYRFENLDRQIEFFIENAPDGYVFINIHLDSREWWMKEHPGSVNSFTHLSQIAADEDWRKDTADYLKALIAHAEEKYGDKIVGYYLLGGFTTEWFSQFDHEEPHPTKLKAYREYLNDPLAEIPSKERLERAKEQLYLDPIADADVIRYRRFHHHLIADTVLYFASAAQEVLKHEKPLGLFFGYILELLDDRMWDAGHIEFDRINRSTDIDFLATPSSYQFRSYDDAGAYMLLCDTLALNNKMCWISFDHTTFLVPDLPENPERVCGDPGTDVALKTLAAMRASNPRDLLKTKEQTLHAMRREFMQRMTKRTGYWWFDMLEGWFYDKDLMAEVKHQVEISHRLNGFDKYSVSEIAVFISGESLYHVNKMSELNTELICNQRDALSRMGAPYDIYSLNDLERVDSSRYKLIILSDALLLTDAQKAYIRTTLCNSGRTVLVIGPSGFTDETGADIRKTEALWQISLQKNPYPEREIRAMNTVYGYKNPKTPMLYVSDPQAKTFGRFATSRKPALVKKDFADHTLWYSAVGNLRADVLREIAREAGVFLYNESGAAVFASHRLYGIYNTSAEETVLRLPENGKYEELFSGKRYTVTDHTVTLPTGDEPAQFLVKCDE